MKISINEPCHENWDNMTPNEQGAFCLSCQKNVVDFSSKTLNQIKDFFRNKTDTESVCGRFDERQLDALTFDDFLKDFMSWRLVQKAALIVFFIFGLSLFGGAQTKPKDKPVMHPKMGAVAYVPQDTAKKVCKKDTAEIYPVKGKVKYDNGKKPKQQSKQKPKPVISESLTDDKKTKTE